MTAQELTQRCRMTRKPSAEDCFDDDGEFRPIEVQAHKAEELAFEHLKKITQENDEEKGTNETKI